MKKLFFLLFTFLFFSANSSYSQTMQNVNWTDPGYGQMSVSCGTGQPNAYAERMTIRLGSNFSSSSPCSGNSYYPIQQLFLCGTTNPYTGVSYPSCINNAPIQSTPPWSAQVDWEYGAFVNQGGQWECVGLETLGSQYGYSTSSTGTAEDLDIDVFRTPLNQNLEIHLFIRNNFDTTEIYKLNAGYFDGNGNILSTDIQWNSGGNYCTSSMSCNFHQSALGVYNLAALYSISNYGYGCTNTSALNYNSNAIYDDGSCCYVAGCTDSLAINYSLSACYNDGSCIYPVYGCMDPTMFNYNPLANTPFSPSNCIPFVYGCTIQTDPNYNPLANTDDGSCAAFNYGCIDSTAFNYSPLAIIDDKSCIPTVYG
jgi:hypothetical protein